MTVMFPYLRHTSDIYGNGCRIKYGVNTLFCISKGLYETCKHIDYQVTTITFYVELKTKTIATVFSIVLSAVS